MRNKQASIFNVLIAHEQNQKIRRAILASGNRADMAEMRKAFSILINNSRTASQKEVETLLNNTDSPEVKEKVGLSYLTEILKHYKEKFIQVVFGTKEDWAEVKRLTKQLGREVNDYAYDSAVRWTKGEWSIGGLIAGKLKEAGSFSSTLGVLGDLLSARTPQELADLVDKDFHEMRAYFGVERKRRDEYENEADMIPDWFFEEWRSINKHIAGFPDYKTNVYYTGIAVLKHILMYFLAKTALGALGGWFIQLLAAELLYNIITGEESTELSLRKLGISFSLIPTKIIKDIAKGFSFLKGKASEYISRGWEKFKGLFRRAAVERINYLLQTDRQFRLAYSR